MKIISGGQTGVDRGALDAALSVGVECGGWCPEGRKAEDGTIPERYPLEELPGAGYHKRTVKNVIDSDATVIIYWGELSDGTLLTLKTCLKHQKPFKLIDALLVGENEAAAAVMKFTQSYRVESLNFAGPRASAISTAQGYARKLAEHLLTAANK